ncbi:MAG TPA: hypothetical protein VJY65_00125 [Chloroflexota bacterium]|nr:hypothetical protein [Chloroflexota bacterium]
MDDEDWCGLTVRTRDGTMLGVVVGAFARGPECTPRQRATYVTFDGVEPARRRDAPFDTPLLHTVRGIGCTLRAVAGHV